MEIVGNVNITGAYNINNRNVIADTSNYILSTSNILVGRINASGGGSGSLTSGGNLTLSNNATSNTVLSIANSNVVYGTIQGTSNYTSNVITETAFVATFADANVPSTHAQVTSSTDRYMIFTTASSNHTFTVPAGGLNCDILMIGGGGRGYNGGGGAGACIVAINQTLPSGSCVVVVGAGGATNSMNGSDSFIKVETVDRYRAKGGGFCPTDGTISGSPGGCGGGTEMYIGSGNTASGGAAVSTNVVNGVIENTPPRITSTYAVMGNAGGNNSSPNNGGSGGGIGTVGTTGGTGGNGAYQVTLTTSPTTTINFRNYFANGSTSFGVQYGTTGNYYIGGGGGAYAAGMGVQSGGLGGGGYFGGGPYYGVANTGSGGSAGGTGGSGIIIIRYRSVSTTPTLLSTPITIPTTTFGVPTIELIRGTQGDTNTDYKLGNYDGNFKIMSSISSIDTDRLSINSSTNSTALSIINRDFVVGSVFPAITTDLNTTGTVSKAAITSSTDRFMVFTTGTGTFAVPTGGIECDILMIGGGGAGGNGSGAGGGGGGAGACIVAIRQTLATGTYTVNVGAGDTASGTTTGAGGDSSIILGTTTLYLAKGGGRGEYANNGINRGGCGGGSGTTVVKTGAFAVNTNIVSGIIVGANTITSTYAVFGNKGGDKQDITNANITAGGGGIAGAGGDHRASANNINAGPGGSGLYQATVGGTVYNFRNYFANAGTPTTFGVQDGTTGNFYIGGGGGGSVSGFASGTIGGSGGLGGGGTGGITGGFTAAVQPTSATVNTGSGGGGGISSGTAAGNGGSGIVIVRYRVAPATVAVGVPSVELIRGVAGDSNHDYKVGNYDGNFKIMSSVSGTADTERLNITSSGNVGIGTLSNNKLLLYDEAVSRTTLTIQNNNLFNTVNTTQSTSNIAGEAFIADFSASAYLPSVHEAVTAAPTDRIMIFRTASSNHTFTVPSGGLNCDILMIGGGGGGGEGYGNAGGAGACIVAINQTLPAGSCVVFVGGGNFGVNNGQDSIIQVATLDRYRAKGGGYAVSSYSTNGIPGGCGGSVNSSVYSGGSAVSTNVVNGSTAIIGPTGSTTNGLGYAVLGNAGYGGSAGNNGGGGGGIGSAGTSTKGGEGAYLVTINGTIYNFRGWFANGGNNFGVLHTDSNYYIGGGGLYANPNPLVAGGGGSQDVDAIANTGGGGGGGGDRSVAGWGYGGSGIIIIRYRSGTIDYKPVITPTSTTTLGTPSIELIRGGLGDSNTDYRLSNNLGNFLIERSVGGIETDYMRIDGINGSITNPMGTAVWSIGSDSRIKENIEDASYERCYESMGRLELRRFSYKEGYNRVNRDRVQLGFIAQEVRDIFPKAITAREYKGEFMSLEDMLSIDLSQINYTLYGTVKRLMEKGEVVERRIERMERMLEVCGDGMVGSNVVVSGDVSGNGNVVVSGDGMVGSNVVIE